MKKAGVKMLKFVITLLLIYVLTLLACAIASKKTLKTLTLTCFSGLALLFILHATAKFSGIWMPLNWATAGISTAFGVPGVILLLLLNVVTV